MTERPNVVVLVLDSARASALSCYGGEAETPNIDRLAADGVRFENAFSPGVWTVPSHASLFTGVYPSEHGTDKGNRYLNPNYETLAEKLSSVGYQTVLYTNNVHLTDQFGFTRGFDVTGSSHAVATDEDVIDWNDFLKNRDHDSGPMKYLEIAKALFENRDKSLVKSVRQAVELKYHHHFGDNGARQTNEFFRDLDLEPPYFAFVNYMEPHNPFRPPRRYCDEDPVDVTGWRFGAGIEDLTDEELARLKRLYRAEIEYVDERVGELVAELDDGDTVFVVTSDHGVELAEHGFLYHGDDLYNTVTRVPLVISGLDRRDSVPYTAGIIGLHRTLLDLAGYDDVGDHVRGEDLLDLDDHGTAYMEMQGENADIVDTIRAAAGDEAAARADRHRRAVAHGRYKYIRDMDGDSEELYDYWADPDEQEPLSDAAALEEMRGRVDAVVESLAPRENTGGIGDLEDGVEDQLEQLGYIT